MWTEMHGMNSLSFTEELSGFPSYNGHRSGPG